MRESCAARTAGIPHACRRPAARGNSKTAGWQHRLSRNTARRRKRGCDLCGELSEGEKVHTRVIIRMERSDGGSPHKTHPPPTADPSSAESDASGAGSTRFFPSHPRAAVLCRQCDDVRPPSEKASHVRSQSQRYTTKTSMSHRLAVLSDESHLRPHYRRSVASSRRWEMWITGTCSSTSTAVAALNGCRSAKLVRILSVVLCSRTQLAACRSQQLSTPDSGDLARRCVDPAAQQKILRAEVRKETGRGRGAGSRSRPSLTIEAQPVGTGLSLHHGCPVPAPAKEDARSEVPEWELRERRERGQ